MLTMCLGGLWHGAAWTFVLWGVLHGVYLVVNHAWRAVKNFLGIQREAGTGWRRRGARLVTFLVVTVAWAAFRADDFDAARVMFEGMFGVHGLVAPEHWVSSAPVLGNIVTAVGVEVGAAPYARPTALVWMSVLFTIVWCAPNTHQIMHRYEPAFDTYAGERISNETRIEWRPGTAWATVIAFFSVLSILGLNQHSEFLYFQF